MNYPHDLSAYSTGIPILNVGSFNLATCPDMNVGLMLHFILEMVGRLQMAIQLCTLTAKTSSVAGVESSYRRNSNTRYSHANFSVRTSDEIDRAHNCPTAPSNSDICERDAAGY